MTNTPDWLTSSPIAHRGIHDESVPENSRASIEKAIALELPVELDLQMTMDGRLVVFHDRNTKRLTEAAIPITRAELRELRPLHLPNGESIMTMEELLELVNGKIPLAVEIKPAMLRHRERARAFANVVGSYRGPLVAQSFDSRIVKWLKKHTDIPTGLILGRYKDATLEEAQRINLENAFLPKGYSFRKVTPDFVAHYLRQLTPEIAENIREKMPLITWTVRDELQLAQARVLSDNIIFEGEEMLDIVLEAGRQKKRS